MATPPEALQTKYHSTNILRSEQDSKYKLRQQCDETIFDVRETVHRNIFL
jgi:hypothetical protein